MVILFIPTVSCFTAIFFFESLMISSMLSIIKLQFDVVGIALSQSRATIHDSTIDLLK